MHPGRWQLRLGLALVLLACGIGCYLGWQVWGTTWVSQRAHAEHVERLEDAWTGGAAEVPTDDGDLTAVVRIPRLGAQWAVPVLEGVADEQLAAGLGHFPGSVGPGERGNFALAGHRVTHGEPFRDLPELRTGDLVEVRTAEADYTYRLVTDGDALAVSFDQTWVVDELPRNPEADADAVQPPQRPGARLITLTTCAELFHTDDRLVVFGVLSDVRPR